MRESSVNYLRCVRCGKNLALEKLVEKKEIYEGFLICSNCNILYPIISTVPILWNDFTAYLTRRASLGGELLSDSISPKMIGFVKESILLETQLKTKWVHY